MNQLKLALLLGCLFAIFSCKKNSETEADILKYVDSAYTCIIRPNYPTDTNYILNFKYDQLNRVTTMKRRTASLTGYIVETYEFEYYGSSQLPIKYYYGNNTGAAIVNYCFYDNLGRIIKDSSYSIFKYVITYGYNTNKIYRHSKTLDNLVVRQEQKDTATMDNNGNITNNKSWYYKNYFGSTNIVWLRENEIDFTYENSKSPFENINILNAMFFFPQGNSFTLSYLPINNFKTRKLRSFRFNYSTYTNFENIYFNQVFLSSSNILNYDSSGNFYNTTKAIYKYKPQ